MEPDEEERKPSLDPEGRRRPFEARRRNLTQGGIAANLWHLALPLLISGAMQDIFNIVDMVFVGRLGASAIAGVSMSGVVMGLLRMLAMGTATGTVALVARFVGSREEQAAEEVVGQSILLSVLLSAAIALFGLWLSAPMLRLLGAAEDVVAEGAGYLKLMCLGSVTMFLTLTLSAGSRGFGDALTPMWALGVASLLNVGLDPLLIFGPGPFPRLGTAGAALATVISRGIGTLIMLRPLFRDGRRPRLLPRKGGGYFGRIVSIGSYSALRMLSMNLSRLALVRIVSVFGTFALAAFGIGLRLRIFSLTMGFSLGDATAVVVGQNLGAGRPDRAERGAWVSVLMLGALSGVLSLVFLVAPTAVIGLFTREPEVLRLGARYLYYFAPALMVLTFAIIFGRAVDGAGKTMATMIVTFIAVFAIGIPLAWGLSTVWGVEGVWASLTAVDTVQGVGMFLYFRSGRWKRPPV